MVEDNTVKIENARLVFRNFAGNEDRFNREGDRNFAVLLDQTTADAMAADGWNVKTLEARDEDSEPQPYIKVSVSYKGRPPRIVFITSRGRTDLGENEVEILDWTEFKTVDLIIRPYHWEIGEKTGITAYLKSFYATAEEDALELKYGDINQAPRS